MTRPSELLLREYPVRVATGTAVLDGDLVVPAGALGVVAFAHGSGSSRHSSRNRYVAGQLQAAGLATLLVDLLTEDEGVADARTALLRFDIGLLADRLVGVIGWLAVDPRVAGLSHGLFGASTGGAAALVAAARRPDQVAAVVSRGGRPDLARGDLPAVRCPVLLAVGGDDEAVLGLNQFAFTRLGSSIKELMVLPGAGHLFEEPGQLDSVARLAAGWFTAHLGSR